MKKEQFFEFLDANGISAEPGCNQRILDLYEKLTGQTSFETFNGWKAKGPKGKERGKFFPDLFPSGTRVTGRKAR